jgi:AraC-like DNA-binding protein
MNPVRKQFDSNNSFPFDLVYKDTKSSQSELPDHLHDWFELVYVYRGVGTFFIDQTLYDMRQGDLFMLPGNTIHRAFPDKENPVTSTAIFFSPHFVHQSSLGDLFSYLGCFNFCKTNKSYKPALTLTQQHGLESMIEQMHEELQSKSLGYRQAVMLHLQQILLTLNRVVVQEDPHHLTNLRTGPGPLWMREILLYIDEQLSSANIGLAALAHKASVTSAHFSRVFKELTSMNVTEFIRTKRIIKAKDLLLHTDNNISQIAEMCGFESLPHFHRMFKRVMHMTPAAYRKSAIRS